MLTRADVSVYVVYLQRQQPDMTTFQHIKMLSMVVIRVQTDVERLRYRSKYMFLSCDGLCLQKGGDHKSRSEGHSYSTKIVVEN